MAQIPSNLLKNWKDGDVVKAGDYKLDRDSIVVAHNDTDLKINNLDTRMGTAEQNITSNASSLANKTDKTGNHQGTWQNLSPADFSGGQQAIDLAGHKADNIVHSTSAITTGTGNAYVVTVSPVPTAYVQFMNVVIQVHADSTGAATLNVNGLGARPIKNSAGAAVSNLKAGGIYTLRYNTSAAAFISQGEGSDLSPLVTTVNSILGS